VIEVVIHVVLLIIFPPLILGVINKTKAIAAGRTGAPFLQPYFDLIKLFQKNMVISSTTSWIFKAGPLVTLVSVCIAGLIVPFGSTTAPISFTGDIILFAYLFGLGRFFTTCAALDTGSAFEGMGSAREVTFACLSEPALFFAFLVLAKLSGSLSLANMLLNPLASSLSTSLPSLIMISLGLFVVLLAETCRLPIDDPDTHLELTMIHEAMILDHSGPLLGTILYGSAMKLLVLGALLVNVIFPFHVDNIAIENFLFIAEILGLAVLIGVLESVMARLRMRRVPYLLVTALLLSGSGFILLLR